MSRIIPRNRAFLPLSFWLLDSTTSAGYTATFSWIYILFTNHNLHSCPKMATMSKSEIQHSAQPIDLGCHLDFPPLKRRLSLTLLPNEILAEIFSYLIPRERSFPLLPEKCQMNNQASNDTIDKITSELQNTLTSKEPKVNDLSFMSAHPHFYNLGRQQPRLKYRSYSIEVTPGDIVFEGSTDRPLERLRNALHHVEALNVALDPGSLWYGEDQRDDHFARFIKNYERFFRVFGGPWRHKRRVMNKMKLRVWPPYDRRPSPYLQDFAEETFEALRSGDEDDLADVKWWAEAAAEEFEEDDEWEDLAFRRGLGLMRCARHGEISDALRMVASWLYQE